MKQLFCYIKLKQSTLLSILFIGSIIYCVLLINIFNLICLKRKKSEIYFFQSFYFSSKNWFHISAFPTVFNVNLSSTFIRPRPTTDLRQFQTFSNKFICFQIAMSRAVTGGWKLFILASETSFCSESSN